MNQLYKILSIIVILAAVCIAATYRSSKYNGSAIGVVTLVGAHIKARDVPIVNKYARKDCPVCKGKGQYLSGDGISMVDCGYCEP